MLKLIALLPLLIALIVAVRVGTKALKANPMTDDDKDIAREAGKSAAYIFAAAVLLWWLTPDFGPWLTIIWTILTVIFAVVVIFTVIVLPTKLNKLHNRLWKDGRKTPLYSRSDEPVEHIRWARRIMLAVLIVAAVFSGLVSAISTNSSADPAAEAAPAASAPATSSATPSPTVSASAATAPATSAPSAPVVEDFKNTCGGLNPKKVSDTTIEFKVADKLFICDNGEWKTWAQANPNKTAPTSALLTHWTTDAEKKNGYGVVKIEGTSYLFWTTAIQS